MKRAIATALKEAGVGQRILADLQYGMQLGVDAVYQLAADGYGVEQIVEIVTGKAHADLGWDE